MCHGFDAYDWEEDVEKETEEETNEDPSFLNDEPSDDVTVLTDGGDDE